MKKDTNNFIDEITTNFSELFVETFLLRYLYAFNKNELLDTIQNTKDILNKKISKKFIYSLKNMGYSKKDIDKFLK